MRQGTPNVMLALGVLMITVSCGPPSPSNSTLGRVYAYDCRPLSCHGSHPMTSQARDVAHHFFPPFYL